MPSGCKFEAGSIALTGAAVGPSWHAAWIAYLMTSVITTMVFCGFGLGLYGKLGRFQELAVAGGMWVFILAWSKPWLDRFHYGPFEWAWRSLVRWTPQPFVRDRCGAAPAAV